MKPAPAALGWGAWGTCAAIWGGTFLVIAFGNDQVPPVWGATLRLALASLVLLVIMAILRHPLPRGPALLAAVRFGAFQFGLNFPFLYLGEMRVSSGLTAVIYSTVPLSTAILAWIFGLEQLRPIRIAGALIAVVGVATIFFSQLKTLAEPWPMLFVLLSSWSACLGTVLLKRGPRLSPIDANAIGAGVGAAVCWVWSLLLREPQQLPGEWAAIGPILYLAIVGSVGAFVLFAWLVNHWEVSRISYISVVIPVIALTLGVLLRKEQVSGPSLAGAGIVLTGVVVGLQLWKPQPH